MSKRETYEKRFEELLTPIAEANGVRVYDVEYVKEGADYYLRAYIDKEGGVTIGDCEAVNRAVSDRLDEEDFIPDAYVLEVSSPGLGRALKKDRHLAASIGQAVEGKFYKPLDGKKTFSGILAGYTKDTITLREEALEEADKADDTPAEYTYKRSDVAGLRLRVDF